MDNLVLANIFYRKTRTITTAAGVALGVALVVLTVGIVNGFLNEQGRRNSAVTAEIIYFSQGGILNLSPRLEIKQEVLEQIRKIDGVADVVPLGQLMQENRSINGIEYEPFTRVSGMRVVDGRPFQNADEAIVDRVLERERKLKLGDEIELIGRKFRVVGIYEPESFARIKIPLSTLQTHLNRPGLCSQILIKVKDPNQQEAIAKQIKAQFPDSDIQLTRDLPILYARGTPALQTFLRVVITLAIVISSLVILLAMYTTVVERTRQIGVLKSLGASKGWIAGEIEKEALLISLIGVLSGFLLSLIGEMIIHRFSSVKVELQPLWFLYTFLIGLAAGCLGALYPAIRAANQDPVKALSYE